jgi:hypothetical protein
MRFDGCAHVSMFSACVAFLEAPRDRLLVSVRHHGAVLADGKPMMILAMQLVFTIT